VGYYPIFVEMEGRRVLLVGGGNVAHEKIGKLVDASADVTVVAPALIEPVRVIVEEHGCQWLARPYETGDVEGYEVVMVATDDGAVNARVASEARALGIWVNAADDVEHCDFILPSLAKRGRIALAASTGGASPALARWLRERLEEFLDDEVVALGDLLAEVRVMARQRDRECAAECDRTRTPPPLLCTECPNRITSDAWQDAIDGELRSLLRGGEYDAARDRIIRSLGLDQPLTVPAWQGQPA
jgi:precorrin-2 dehydrogenase/sirohydrochlorin ferrochelatase